MTTVEDLSAVEKLLTRADRWLVVFWVGLVTYIVTSLVGMVAIAVGHPIIGAAVAGSSIAGIYASTRACMARYVALNTQARALWTAQ